MLLKSTATSFIYFIFGSTVAFAQFGPYQPESQNAPLPPQYSNQQVQQQPEELPLPSDQSVTYDNNAQVNGQVNGQVVAQDSNANTVSGSYQYCTPWGTVGNYSYTFTQGWVPNCVQPPIPPFGFPPPPAPFQPPFPFNQPGFVPGQPFNPFGPQQPSNGVQVQQPANSAPQTQAPQIQAPQTQAPAAPQNSSDHSVLVPPRNPQNDSVGNLPTPPQSEDITPPQTDANNGQANSDQTQQIPKLIVNGSLADRLHTLIKQAKNGLYYYPHVYYRATRQIEFVGQASLNFRDVLARVYQGQNDYSSIYKAYGDEYAFLISPLPNEDVATRDAKILKEVETELAQLPDPTAEQPADQNQPVLIPPQSTDTQNNGQ